MSRRVEWLTREVLPAAGIAAGLGCLVFATEVRHQTRWHPNGLGRTRCEAGYCVSRGSARARWRRRLGLSRRGSDRTAVLAPASRHPISSSPAARRSAMLGA